MADKLPDWAEIAADFISQNLLLAVDREGWDHLFSTAYQIACLALVAMGRAEERKWGAVPLVEPISPEVLPRWDDICVSVLGLAHQQRLIDFRLPNGFEPPRPTIKTFSIKRIGAPPPPASNISGKQRLGPAYAKPDVLPVLEKLNLVRDGDWTIAAEFILWRRQPRNWPLEFTGDERFLKAVTCAIEVMPDAIKSQIEALLEISEQHIADYITLVAAAIEKDCEKFGPAVIPETAPTRDEARKAIVFIRKDQLDWLFFRRWRIEEGWLSDEEAKAALEIFHDRLAIEMRKAVIRALYPDRTQFLDG